MDESFDLVWSLESSEKVESIKGYLIQNWGSKTAKKFLNELKTFENLVTRYPKLYPTSLKRPDLRKAVITKHQSIIYEIADEYIKVITVIDNRQKNKHLE